MNHNRWKLVTVLAAALMLVSACGGANDATAKGGDTKIKVAVLPLADYAPVYWAKDHGQFKDQGLDVTFENLPGGPVGVQKVVTGELQFAFSNPISSTIATSKGAPVQTVAMLSGLGKGELGIFVKADSPIKTMADLDKKTVGINTTNNVGDVTFAKLAKAQGIDAKPDWVEVPFPEMIDGVKNGSIQAGYLPEPFASAARQAGLRQVVDLVQGDNVGLPMSTFVTSTQYAKSNPDVVKKFATALNAARDQMAGNDAAFRAWWPKASSTDPAAAKVMHLPTFDVKLDVKEMQSIADFLSELGVIQGKYDAAKYTIVNEG
ncbi:ABC transporter substrate-binding protein [Nocardioides terrisoli]|uniref:ABC transporter substrate-binding protein n=1 Tax=Nocardioides terrisoli TaxID=3388267 RepID=UPI00287BA483|nr:ABC transporter substrate-binding protein [Nocardioides marmorisolisilvae]